MVESSGEVPQCVAGGNEVECHPLRVEAGSDDLDGNPPAVSVNWFGAATIGAQMMRGFEIGVNLDAIAAHLRIVVGRSCARKPVPPAAPQAAIGDRLTGRRRW